MVSFIVLQAVQQPVVNQHAEPMFQIIMKGGWILIPIFFLSLVSFWVICERWMILRRASRTTDLVSVINPMLKEGKLDMAISTCEANNQPVGKVLAAGLHTMGFTIRDIQDAMEAEAHQQIDSLSRGVNYLGIIATIAPMFGFLGTIFGVIKIFYNISLTDNISIGIISGGLYQKMVSSASGLLVGIIAFAGYHLLNSKIDRITSIMERQGNALMAVLRSRG